jgi:hypothetical protein
LQGQDEPDLERQEELYVDDRRRIAILGMDPAKRLLVSRASWLHGFSTNRLRHGKSKVSGWAGGEGDTPRPEAAERPAPHRAMTRLALARVSRNDCSSCGVMIVRITVIHHPGDQINCRELCPRSDQSSTDSCRYGCLRENKRGVHPSDRRKYTSSGQTLADKCIALLTPIHIRYSNQITRNFQSN